MQSLNVSAPEKDFSGLLINFFSFLFYSYKIGFNRTLVDRASKIKTTLATFTDDAEEFLNIFVKNQYSQGLISKVVDSYLVNAKTSNTSTFTTDTSTIYFKLPFLNMSNFT